MQIQTDAVCPLCQEDEETVLHLLGECSALSALSAKSLSILGYTYLTYEKLGCMHWCALGDAANRMAVSHQRHIAVTTSTSLVRLANHVLAAANLRQPQVCRLMRALQLAQRRSQPMCRCRQVHQSSYLLQLLLPGGIAIQETSVTNSSDCSGIWAVINARSLCNKLDAFHLCLSDHNIDVCCVTETWLNNSIPDSFVCPKDYVVYRHDRCSVGGGVAVFVN